MGNLSQASRKLCRLTIQDIVTLGSCGKNNKCYAEFFEKWKYCFDTSFYDDKSNPHYPYKSCSSDIRKNYIAVAFLSEFGFDKTIFTRIATPFPDMAASLQKDLKELKLVEDTIYTESLEPGQKSYTLPDYKSNQLGYLDLIIGTIEGGSKWTIWTFDFLRRRN